MFTISAIWAHCKINQMTRMCKYDRCDLGFTLRMSHNSSINLGLNRGFSSLYYGDICLFLPLKPVSVARTGKSLHLERISVSVHGVTYDSNNLDM